MSECSGVWTKRNFDEMLKLSIFIFIALIGQANGQCGRNWHYGCYGWYPYGYFRGVRPGGYCTGLRPHECAATSRNNVNCINNVCTCVPPAYSNGWRCVGRRSNAACVGPCVNGACSAGFACNTATNLCCVARTTCPSGALSLGPCNNGVCAAGFICNTTLNACCPSCPNNAEVTGACLPGGVCGSGLSCINGLCCRTPGGIIIPPPPQVPFICSDGSQPPGPCVGGICGLGFTCVQEDLCCPVPVVTRDEQKQAESDGSDKKQVARYGPNEQVDPQLQGDLMNNQDLEEQVEDLGQEMNETL